MTEHAVIAISRVNAVVRGRCEMCPDCGRRGRCRRAGVLATHAGAPSRDRLGSTRRRRRLKLRGAAAPGAPTLPAPAVARLPSKLVHRPTATAGRGAGGVGTRRHTCRSLCALSYRRLKPEARASDRACRACAARPRSRAWRESRGTRPPWRRWPPRARRLEPGAIRVGLFGGRLGGDDAVDRASSSRISWPASAPFGLNSRSGFLWALASATASEATAPTNSPRPAPSAAPMTVFSAAAVSFASSIGPPGSDSEIAMPATNGARLIRAQSSSVKSALPVIPAPCDR